MDIRTRFVILETGMPRFFLRSSPEIAVQQNIGTKLGVALQYVPNIKEVTYLFNIVHWINAGVRECEGLGNSNQGAA